MPSEGQQKEGLLIHSVHPLRLGLSHPIHLHTLIQSTHLCQCALRGAAEEGRPVLQVVVRHAIELHGERQREGAHVDDAEGGLRALILWGNVKERSRVCERATRRMIVGRGTR